MRFLEQAARIRKRLEEQTGRLRKGVGKSSKAGRYATHKETDVGSQHSDLGPRSEWPSRRSIKAALRGPVGGSMLLSWRLLVECRSDLVA